MAISRAVNPPQAAEENIALSSPFGGQISRDSLSQLAYSAIRTSLRRSRLKPGQKLVSRQVADELGIPRGLAELGVTADTVRDRVQVENFHLTLCRLAQSPVLFRIVENLWIQFGPLLFSLYDGGSRPFHGRTHGHLLVIDALRKSDPELARDAIRRDILIGGKTLLDRFERVMAPS